MKEEMREQGGMINWKSLILSFVLVLAVAGFGNFFTLQGISSFWFISIKPAITPPNWVFMLAWNIIFFLIALSLYFSLINAKDEKSKIRMEIIFGINFILNVSWTMLYFSLRNTFYAFIVLIIMWLSILLMMWASWGIDKKASFFLIPYLLWVGFVGILNYLTLFAQVS